jgi:NADH-quinone oxidoreductase subunit C
VDKNLLVLKLNKLIPGAVLETRRFGRSGVVSVWIESQSMQKVAAVLKSDSELKLDWLENLSVVEFESVLVITYFVRSSSLHHSFVLRASVAPPSAHSDVHFPSIRSVWPMGESMELEGEEMFGIRFRLPHEVSFSNSFNRLPEGWKGYPLRKGFVFPKETYGIPHNRITDYKSPKKTNS